MIGLDISDRSIKIVELSNTLPRRLLSHCWYAMPDEAIVRGIIRDPDVTREVLKKSFEQCRITPTPDAAVVASIPETRSFLRVIEVPIMQEDEVDEAIQWEVAQHIPFGLENVYIDWQSVQSGHKAAAGRQEVLVGAVQKKVVDPLLEVLSSLDLDLAALELESQALVRALISDELRKRQGLLIVDVGGTVTNVIIHDHSTMRFTASLQHGAQNITSALSAEEMQLLAVPRHDELDPDFANMIAQKMQAAQEELVMEIRGVVEFYNGIDAQHEVAEVLMTGGGSNFPGLDKVLLGYFEDVHVQRGSPWVNILPDSKTKKPPLSLRESVHFSTALGLALRKVDV